MRVVNWFRNIIGRIFSKPYAVAPWNGDAVFDERLSIDQSFGLEIVNDDKTPMEFVVAVLTQGVHLNDRDATEAMLRIHFNGRARFGRMTEAGGRALVEHINQQSAEFGWPLSCSLCDGQETASPGPPSKEDIQRHRKQH